MFNYRMHFNCKWQDMCSQKVGLFLLFLGPPTLGCFSCSFQTEMEVYKQLWRHQVEGYLDSWNLQGQKWPQKLKNEHTDILWELKCSLTSPSTLMSNFHAKTCRNWASQIAHYFHYKLGNGTWVYPFSISPPCGHRQPTITLELVVSNVVPKTTLK
jgi:hypothetical protein